MKPQWTLITVTWNSASALEEFWTQPPQPDVEWIVVDNCSSDESVAVAKRLGAKVISLDENVGFSRANNIGAGRAIGEYIGFINPDVRVQFNDLKRLGSLSDCLQAIVAPQLLNSDGTPQSNARGFPTVANKLSNRLPFRGSASYALYACDGDTIYAAWCMGAVVVANRKIFEAINFWNERFFVYYEDSDLGLRSWAKGYPVIVDGSSRWVHGWARETHGRFRWRPWINEMRALGVFLSLHPEMLFGEFVSRRSHATVATNIGRKIDSSELPTTTGDG